MEDSIFEQVCKLGKQMSVKSIITYYCIMEVKKAEREKNAANDKSDSMKASYLQGRIIALLEVEAEIAKITD